MAANEFYLPFEVGLMEWIQSWMPEWMTSVMSVISMAGETLPLVAILGFIYWSYRKEFGKVIGAEIVTANVLFPMIKNIALRKRPYMVHSGIRCLKPVDASADIMDISKQGYSFPSGHSANSTVAYAGIAHYTKNKILIVIGIVLPFLVGISRFALGVHYPTDVLAGWALGAAIVFFIPWVLQKVGKLWKIGIVVACVGAVGFFYCKTTDFFTSYGLMLGFFLGTAFEEQKVHFSDTKRILAKIIRLAVGVGLYLGLNELLKLPFPKDFLSSVTIWSFLVRTFRYAVVSFILIGVYPLLFDRLPFLHDKK